MPRIVLVETTEKVCCEVEQVACHRLCYRILETTFVNVAESCTLTNVHTVSRRLVQFSTVGAVKHSW